jgi:uncharacterized protein YkwD
MHLRICGRQRHAAKCLAVPIALAGCLGTAAPASAEAAAPAAPTGSGPDASTARASTVARASRTSCAAATRARGTASARVQRAALLCVLNAERRRRGLRPLRARARLAAAASTHAVDMVRRRYFAHQRAGGPTLARRLAAAGWRGRAVGEAIGYGCAGLAQPAAIVRAWLNSPPHRRIALGRGWRYAGIGRCAGVPYGGCASGAAWVLDVGR